MMVSFFSSGFDIGLQKVGSEQVSTQLVPLANPMAVNSKRKTLNFMLFFGGERSESGKSNLLEFVSISISRSAYLV